MPPGAATYICIACGYSSPCRRWDGSRRLFIVFIGIAHGVRLPLAWGRDRFRLRGPAARAYLSASAAAGSGMGKGGRVGRPLKLLLLAGCAVVAGIPAFLLGGGAQSLEAYRLGRMSPDDRARAQQAAHLQDPGLAVIGGEKAQVDAEIAKLLAEAASISDEAAKLEDEVAAALPALSDSARSDLGMDQGDVALVTSRIQHLHAQLPEIQRQLDVDFGAAVR